MMNSIASMMYDNTQGTSVHLNSTICLLLACSSNASHAATSSFGLDW
jgi:hypothetical protein